MNKVVKILLWVAGGLLAVVGGFVSGCRWATREQRAVRTIDFDNN